MRRDPVDLFPGAAGGLFDTLGAMAVLWGPGRVSRRWSQLARNVVGPFARYLDQDSLVVGHHRNQLVVHRECQAGGIKPRSDVRAARGNEYPYRFRSKGGHYSAKPNARAAAVGSTGTTTGSGADSRAHCGSFSPLPVTVTTII